MGRTLAALQHLKLAGLHDVQLAGAQPGVALLDQDLAGLHAACAVRRVCRAPAELGKLLYGAARDMRWQPGGHVKEYMDTHGQTARQCQYTGWHSADDAHWRSM